MKLRQLFGCAAALVALGSLARATQNELVPPTSGIYTGVQYSQKIGDAFRSLASCNKGATAPANVGGSAVDGLCWIDDSATPWIIKKYVNGGWAVIGAFDPADSSYLGVIGGGAPASIDSASGPVIDLGSVPQAIVNITGTTTLTGFGASAQIGVVKFLRFAGALKLTNSGSLAIPGGFDLVTAAGDRAIVTHLGSGNWEVTQYTRASGVPVDVSAVGKIDYGMFDTVPANHVAGYGQALTRSSYPAYLAKMTRVQNGMRTSGNATIASVASTAGLGAGMPVESTGVNAGCTIASLTSNSITLNSSSCVTSSGTSPVTVFLTGYGAGGSSSTVGVVDCRGRTMAGRDRNDPGSLASRLTSSYFGADSSIFNVAGGLESQTLSIANINAFTPTVASASISGTGSLPVQGFAQTGTALSLAISQGSNNGGPNPLTLSVSGTATIVMNSLGSGTPHRTVQPTLIAECVVRVTP